MDLTWTGRAKVADSSSAGSKTTAGANDAFQVSPRSGCHFTPAAIDPFVSTSPALGTTKTGPATSVASTPSTNPTVRSN